MAAAHTVLQECLVAGHPLPIVGEASLGWARARICADLCWRLDRDTVVCLNQLTVKCATRLQSQNVSALDEIRRRHGGFVSRVSTLDVQFLVAPPGV